MKTMLLLLFCFTCSVANAQQPRYTIKKFLTTLDTNEFRIINPGANGFIRSYVITNVHVMDIDDDSTTMISGNENAVICFEGNLKNGKKEGVFSAFLIDGTDHKKRYRIWEQTYSNDHLNGQWRRYALRGVLLKFQTFKNDSLNGLSREFLIDGKTVISEQEYFGSRLNLISRNYKNGRIKSETPVQNGQREGIAKSYYENGNLAQTVTFKKDSLNGISRDYEEDGKTISMEREYAGTSNAFRGRKYYPNGKPESEVMIKNDQFEGTCTWYYENGNLKQVTEYKNDKHNGSNKYYYSNGQLWVDIIFKDGLEWTVIGNYTKDGKKRDGGTLKNGNGTVKYYEEDGTLREVLTFVNGRLKK